MLGNLFKKKQLLPADMSSGHQTRTVGPLHGPEAEPSGVGTRPDAACARGAGVGGISHRVWGGGRGKSRAKRSSHLPGRHRLCPESLEVTVEPRGDVPVKILRLQPDQMGRG